MSRYDKIHPEEDDGMRDCCPHGVPDLCPCHRCDTEENQAAARRRPAPPDREGK